MTYAEHKYCNALQYWKSCNSFQFDAVRSSSAPWHLGSCELQYFRATLPQAAGVTGCLAKRQDSRGPPFSRENISVSSVLNSKNHCVLIVLKLQKLHWLLIFIPASLQKSFCTDQFDVKLSALTLQKQNGAELPEPKRAEERFCLITQNEGLQWTGMDQCNGLPLGENGKVVEGKSYAESSVAPTGKWKVLKLEHRVLVAICLLRFGICNDEHSHKIDLYKVSKKS